MAALRWLPMIRIEVVPHSSWKLAERILEW